jgi:hypothetical protein
MISPVKELFDEILLVAFSLGLLIVVCVVTAHCDFIYLMDYTTVQEVISTLC